MNGNDVIASSLQQHTPETVFTVAVLGAESTGKTTLCRDLAAHFDSVWVPEYMRTYLQQKWDLEQKTCTWDDLLPIAKGQIALENQLAAQAAAHGRYLFCDTSLFELMTYAKWYYDDCPSVLQQAALAQHYDMILLTDADIPWVADDLRDSPHDRKAIRDFFIDQLTRYGKDFRYISGNRKERVAQVVNWSK